MPATMPQDSRPQNKRTPARWAERAAEGTGLSPATVEYNVHGPLPLQERLATIIRALIEEGEVGLLAKIEAPLDAARAMLPIPEFDAELIRRAVEADEEEAIARDAYLLSRSAADLRKWRIAQETARGLAFLLLLATQREEARQLQGAA